MIHFVKKSFDQNESTMCGEKLETILESGLITIILVEF